MADQEFVTRVSLQGAETMRAKLAGIGAEMRNLGSSGTLAAKAVAGVVGAFAAMRGAAGFQRFLGAAVKDAMLADEVMSRLRTSLKDQAEGADVAAAALAKLSAELQKKSRFGDEAIANSMAQLAQYKMTRKEIEETIPRILDMAEGYRRVTGQTLTLEDASKLMGRSFAGEVTALKRYGIIIDEAEYKSKGYLAVLEEIDKRYKGQAQASLKTFAGELDALNNSWSDFRQTVGESLGVALRPMLRLMTGATDMITKLSDATKGTVGFVIGLGAAALGLIASLTMLKMAIRIIREEWNGVAGAANRAALAQMAASSIPARGVGASATKMLPGGTGPLALPGQVGWKGKLWKAGRLAGKVGKFGNPLAILAGVIGGSLLNSMGDKAIADSGGQGYGSNLKALLGKGGGGALSGAALGATVGSFVPVIGTAIGAAVGGVIGAGVGIRGGKKQADEARKAAESNPLVKQQATSNSLLKSIADLLGEQNRIIISGGARSQNAYNQGDIQRAIFRTINQAVI